MQGNLSLSPRAKQVFGSFQHLAAAFHQGDRTAGRVPLPLVKRADQKCALARIVSALFGVLALSRYTLDLPRHGLFLMARVETDVLGESVMGKWEVRIALSRFHAPGWRSATSSAIAGLT
jgi:hypothetical protein